MVYILTMKEYADKFAREHRGKGVVSKVTSYSFTYTTLPLKKDEKPVSCVYMLSYFWEPQK